MPRSMHGRGRGTGPAVAGALAALVLLAGPAPAGAAKHRPCPATGVTVARGTYPNLRVWRQSGVLRACLREPGEARRIRTLGPWAAGTRVAVVQGQVTWVTPRAAGGATVDALRTIDVRFGERWLTTTHAVPAAPGTPARDGRVVGLRVDGLATAWVTDDGTVAAALRLLDREEPATLDDAVVPHLGRLFVVKNVGAGNADAVAKSLRFMDGGDSDECGGETDESLLFDEPGRPYPSYFTFLRRVVEGDPAICS